MSRHFVLDFDGTLIDTDVYWEWVVKQFLGFGHDEEEVRLAGEKLFPVCYTVEQHALDLGMSNEQAKQMWDHVRAHVEKNHASLVFPDVAPFLSRLEGTKSVMTFGHREHQTHRVQASGLVPPITDIYIATLENSKAAQLARMVDISMPITFVDDDVEQLAMVQEQGLSIDLVRIRRPGQRKSKDDHKLDHEAWRVIESFDELE
jgi:FMN phosphatase YigB (HAD superfamily)